MLNFLAAIAGNGAGGGGSFESIATATGTGSSATVTFSSIPSTYQHLQLRIMAKYTATTYVAEPMFLRFNSDATGSNYYFHHLRGNGSTVGAVGGAGTSDGFQIGYVPDSTTSPSLANIMGVVIVDIHDYASTTKNKTTRGFTGFDYNTADTNAQVRLTSGLWMSTNAINSITVQAPRSSWTTSSTFALYGIKGA